MILYAPASSIPVELFTILKLYAILMSDVFFNVNLYDLDAYINVGLNSMNFT
jgi:hypothetical protein